MSDDLQEKLLVIFQAEAREHLEGIRRHLETLALKSDPKGPELEEAFRRAHSLKGAARAVGLSPVEHQAHEMETVFSRMRQGTIVSEPSLWKSLTQTLDTIEDGVAAQAKRSSSEEIPALTTESDPSVSSGENMVRIHVQHLDSLRRLSGEVLTEDRRQQGLQEHMRAIQGSWKTLEKKWERLRQRTLRSTSAVTYEPVEAVDQELRHLRRLVQSAQSAQHATAWTFRRLGDQLREEVRQVSKVPAESIFQGFRKMVRDLARDEGKNIDFHLVGLSTEADRSVLQALKDPVMHLLRNAISHGIERHEDRTQAGKTVPAGIWLRLGTRGNRLNIFIEDDGRGLQFSDIAQVALAQGKLSPEQSAKANPEELTALLFQTGFTTSRAVSELSGRGLGLSIVQETVQRLGGQVQVCAREGGGTRFQLSVPLSSATHRLLLVRVKGQTLAIPAHAVDRLLCVKLKEIEPIQGRPSIKVAGHPVPLVPLAYLLQMENVSLQVKEEQVPVLLLKDQSQPLALAVDGFVTELEGVIVDMGKALSSLRTVMGGIVIEDGSVVCVLNISELMALGMGPFQQALWKVEAAPPPRLTPRILVVDDSITTRTLEKSILEAQGFQVRLAVDGMDALEKLKVETTDLAIVDVQMPRMDGFTLVERMKQTPALSKIPVIMVTSLEEKKDQERGLAAGVDAYIVKRKFDHQQLLETIRQIL